MWRVFYKPGLVLASVGTAVNQTWSLFSKNLLEVRSGRRWRCWMVFAGLQCHPGRRSSVFGEGHGGDRRKVTWRDRRRLVRVLLRCLCDSWLPKQKSDGLGRVGSRDQKSAWGQRVPSATVRKWKTSGERSLGYSKWRSEFEIEEKERVQGGNGIQFEMLVEGLKRVSDWLDSNASSCNINL